MAPPRGASLVVMSLVLMTVVVGVVATPVAAEEGADSAHATTPSSVEALRAPLQGTLAARWKALGLPPVALLPVTGTSTMFLATSAAQRAAGVEHRDTYEHRFVMALPVPAEHPAQGLFEAARLALHLHGLRTLPSLSLPDGEPPQGDWPLGPPWPEELTVEQQTVAAQAERLYAAAASGAPSTPVQQLALLRAVRSPLVAEDVSDARHEAALAAAEGASAAQALTWLATAAAAGLPAAKVVLAQQWLFADRAILPDAAWEVVSDLLAGTSGPALGRALTAHLRRVQASALKKTQLQAQLQALRASLARIRLRGFSLRSLHDAQILLATALEDLHAAWAPARDVLTGQHVAAPWWRLLQEAWGAAGAAMVASGHPGLPGEGERAPFLLPAAAVAPAAEWEALPPLRLAPEKERSVIGGAVAEWAAPFIAEADAACAAAFAGEPAPHVWETVGPVPGTGPGETWMGPLGLGGTPAAMRGEQGAVGLARDLLMTAGVLRGVGVRDAVEAGEVAQETLALLHLAGAPAPVFSAFGARHVAPGQVAPWATEGVAAQALHTTQTLPGALPLLPHSPARRLSALGGPRTPAEARRDPQNRAQQASAKALATLHWLAQRGRPLAAMAVGRALSQPDFLDHPVQWPAPEAWNATLAPRYENDVCDKLTPLLLPLAGDVLSDPAAGASVAGFSTPFAKYWEDAQTSAGQAEKPDAWTYQKHLAEAGDAAAAARLGEYYYHGDEAAGVPQDMAAAQAWWRRAAGAGHGLGHVNLAMMYVNGLGAAEPQAPQQQQPPDPAAYAEGAGGGGVAGGGWGQQPPAGNGMGGGGVGGGGGLGGAAGGGAAGGGAAGGGARGGGAPGGVWAGGAGQAEEEEWVEDFGDEPMPGDEDFDPLAPRRRHVLVETGDGRVLNVTGALFHYHTAAALGEAGAYNGLGYVYTTGLGGAVPANDSAAALYFSLAVDAGVAEAAGNLAVSYLQGKGVARNATRARQLLEHAVSGTWPPNLNAQYNLALTLLNGWDAAFGRHCNASLPHLLGVLGRGGWVETHPASTELALAAFVDGMGALGRASGAQAVLTAQQRAELRSTKWALPSPTALAPTTLPAAPLLAEVMGGALPTPLWGEVPTAPAEAREEAGEVLAALVRNGKAAVRAARHFGRTVAYAALRATGDVAPVATVRGRKGTATLPGAALGPRDLPVGTTSPPPPSWRVALRHELLLAAAGSLPAADDGAWLLDRGVGREDWAPLQYPSWACPFMTHFPVLGFTLTPQEVRLVGGPEQPVLPWRHLLHSTLGLHSAAQPQSTLVHPPSKWPLLFATSERWPDKEHLPLLLSLSAYGHSFTLAATGNWARVLDAMDEPPAGPADTFMWFPGLLDALPAPDTPVPSVVQPAGAVEWGLARGLAARRLEAQAVALGGRRAMRRAGECALTAALASGAAQLVHPEHGGVFTLASAPLGLTAVGDAAVGRPLGGFTPGTCPANATLGLALLHSARRRHDAAAEAHLGSLRAAGVAEGGRLLLQPNVTEAWRDLVHLATADRWSSYHASILQHRLVVSWALAAAAATPPGRWLSGALGAVGARGLPTLLRQAAHNDAVAAALAGAPAPDPQGIGRVAEDVEAEIAAQRAAAAGQPAPSRDPPEAVAKPEFTQADYVWVPLGPFEVEPLDAAALYVAVLAAVNAGFAFGAWALCTAAAAEAHAALQPHVARA